MGKSVYRNGTVMSGDYAGKGVYIFSDAGVSILSNDENGKIIINSLFPTRFSILRKLSSHSVLRHKIVSQGIGSYDIAVYFKDGKKSLIRFYTDFAYQEFERAVFQL